MAINIGALLDNLRSAWKKFNEGETITIYAKNRPQSAFAEATQQVKQTPPKLVAVSQNKTNAIMNNTAGNVAGANTSVGKARNPAFGKFTVSPQVQDALSQAASKYQVPPELLYDIALQESSYDPAKTNPDAPTGLNPLGLFQFTDSTWQNILNQYNNKPGMTLSLPNTNRLDPYTSAAAAAYLIKHGQLGKWDASEGVWGNYYTPQELESQGFYSQSKYHQPGVRPSIRLQGGNNKGKISMLPMDMVNETLNPTIRMWSESPINGPFINVPIDPRGRGIRPMPFVPPGMNPDYVA